MENISNYSKDEVCNALKFKAARYFVFWITQWRKTQIWNCIF